MATELQTGNVIFERSKFDAAGQMKEFSKRQKYGGGQQTLHDITTITTQSYDGDGERVKEFEHSESTQTPSSLPQPVITQQTEYYARSSVTGKIITELDAAGAKKTTKVYVGSALLAEQRVYAASSEVVWQHGDPVTGSVRQTLKTGAVALYDGARSRRELEPLGGIVPPTDPYFQEEINTPEYEYGGDIKRPEFGCTLPETGQPAPCNVAAALANHIGRVDDTIAENRWRNSRRHRPRNYERSNSRGNLAPLPDDYIGADNQSSLIRGLRREMQNDRRGWVVDNSVVAQTQYPKRRMTNVEALILGDGVTSAADNTGLCRKYIKDLIEQAARNAGLTKDDIVSTNVEALLAKVLGSRGSGPMASSGGGFIGPAGRAHNASNNWAWVGGQGFAEFELSYPTTNLLDRLGSSRTGMSAIHELMHVALREQRESDNDAAYANAVADLAGGPRPIFTYDPDKPPSPTNRGINYQASEYWDARLNQACGLPAASGPMTGRMTNHKLYK